MSYEHCLKMAQNKLVVRRLVEEVFNRGDVRLLPALVAADYVLHDQTGDLYGPEGALLDVIETRASFPDLQIAIDDLVADGDRVVRRFTLRGTQHGPFLAVPATGRAISVTGIAIDRLAEGKLAECWVSLDVLGLLLQLGVALRNP